MSKHKQGHHKSIGSRLHEDRTDHLPKGRETIERTHQAEVRSLVQRDFQQCGGGRRVLRKSIGRD